MPNLEAKHQKYKGRVVLRGDIVKDNSGSYAVFTEQGSSASQMTAAKDHGYHLQTAGLRWTSSRRSISLYPSKNGRCSQIIENSKIGMSRHLDTSSTTQVAPNLVAVRKIQSFLLNAICTVIFHVRIRSPDSESAACASRVEKPNPTGDDHKWRQ